MTFTAPQGGRRRGQDKNERDVCGTRFSRDPTGLCAARLPVLKMYTRRANSCVKSPGRTVGSRSRTRSFAQNQPFSPVEPELATRAERLSAPRVYGAAMRIRTDGKFAYREELVDDVADRLDRTLGSARSKRVRSSPRRCFRH